MEIAVIVLLIVLIVIVVSDRVRARRRWQEQGEALTRVVGDKVEGSVAVFGEVRERLGELSKQTRNVEEIGRSIASLQEALRVPKFRGGFGELGLERLLADCLPSDYYSLQYRFRNGDTVDAVICVGENLVPIDSKFPFPLDDFERMVTVASEEEQARLRRQFIRVVKKHLDDISKYILPEEKTFDFALMYIPAENIYYEAIVRCPLSGEENDIYAHCLRRRVFPVSPNSFYAYLRAIALGLKGLQVEKSAQEILGKLESLQKELGDFQNDYELIGRHLSSAVKKHAEASARLTRLGGKLELLTGESPGLPGGGESQPLAKDASKTDEV